MDQALDAYRARVAEELLVGHRVNVQIWAALAPHQKKASKPPELPTLLKEITRG